MNKLSAIVDWAVHAICRANIQSIRIIQLATFAVRNVVRYAHQSYCDIYYARSADTPLLPTTVTGTHYNLQKPNYDAKMIIFADIWMESRMLHD